MKVSVSIQEGPGDKHYLVHAPEPVAFPFTEDGKWAALAYATEMNDELKESWIKSQQELDKLRVQLAACGVAALGYDKEPLKPGDWAYSASYGDVIRLRLRLDAAMRVIEATKEFKDSRQLDSYDKLNAALAAFDSLASDGKEGV